MEHKTIKAILYDCTVSLHTIMLLSAALLQHILKRGAQGQGCLTEWLYYFLSLSVYLLSNSDHVKNEELLLTLGKLSTGRNSLLPPPPPHLSCSIPFYM